MNVPSRLFMCAVLIFFAGCSFNRSINITRAAGPGLEKLVKPDGKSVEAFFDLEINGSQQRVLIQSDNCIDSPVLLYLHGGPGSSLMMYSHLYEKQLKKNFIYVNWDMRGAGLSYHEGMDASKMSEGQLADDALALIDYLRNTFGKKKIYLIGHSFGSVMGMYLVDKHPDLFHAYIGIGQVINYDKSVKLTYDWLHEVLEKKGDLESLERIEKDRFPYIDLVVKYGGHHDLSINLDDQIRKSPYYFEGYLEQLKNGKTFTLQSMDGKPGKFGIIEKIRKTDVPLYFFEGRKDHVIACSPELVAEYCRTVEAPVKKTVWFEKSAHYIPVEEPEKFQFEVVKVLRENSEN